MPFDGTDQSEATISEFLRRIFPYGTWWPGSAPVSGTKPTSPDFQSAPNFPTDVFAAAALLLQRSGGLSQLIIGDPNSTVPEALGPALEQMKGAVRAGGPDFENPATCNSFLDAAKKWSTQPRAPDLVAHHWKRLLSAGDDPVYKIIPPKVDFPSWWSDALALLIIADQACEDVGWVIAEANEDPATGRKPVQSIAAKFAYSAYLTKNERAFDALEDGKDIITVSESLATLCLCVDPEVVCVQPKVRTPPVGCTLRSYSHNLALLPPRGIMKTYWQHPPGVLSSEDTNTLNLLIVPYPYRIRAKWFEFAEVIKRWPDGRRKLPRWGWFALRQRWLNEKIIEFTEHLLELCTARCRKCPWSSFS